MVNFLCKFNGTMYLVGNDGQVSSFAYGFNDLVSVRSDVRFWLSQRPGLCFVSVVVGSILVASAGVFPWADSRVSLAPLGC